MTDSFQLQLTENARIVLEKRYLLRGSDGAAIENPEQLFQRVARAVAQGDAHYGASAEAIDKLEQQFLSLMTSFGFLPNSPTLMNAGKPNGQLSACFVLPVADSLDGIFDTLKHAALIHQSGGGTGFSFSRLRPQGDRLKYTSGVTSGPLSFMDVYNAATEAIKQGGTRRGANMGILRIDHPDIEAFIMAKNDLTRLTNFNISVAVTDEFMQAFQAGTDFALLHPNTRQVVKMLPAKHIMEQIVQSAWQTGEPGLVFIDRIQQDNPTPGLGEIEATNPCGEVPLLPYEACNLGSINLVAMLKQVGQSWEMDWERLKETTYLAIHFLDNVITQNNFPLPSIQSMVNGNRKIGLGVMGWADTLIQLGVAYDSEAALQWAEEVMAFIHLHSKWASVKLAQERGAFPFFSKSVYCDGTWHQTRYGEKSALQQISTQDWQALDNAVKAHGLRNATTISLAPTGTISLLAAVSGGIEPLFAFIFHRNVLEQTHMVEVHPYFKDALAVLGLDALDFAQDMEFNHGSIQHLSAIPHNLRHVFKVASDIAPQWHVRMQAAFQKYSDNAVSKTINFPEHASQDDIQAAYHLAYQLGLKGMTVYRNNSRTGQPMCLSHPDSRYCPDCKIALVLQEGCLQCPSCQYAFCG